MSKLAHSDDKSMFEIELAKNGITKIIPMRPDCDMLVSGSLYVKPHLCPYEAKFIMPNGNKLCKLHMLKELPTSSTTPRPNTE